MPFFELELTTLPALEFAPAPPTPLAIGWSIAMNPACFATSPGPEVCLLPKRSMGNTISGFAATYLAIALSLELSPIIGLLKALNQLEKS